MTVTHEYDCLISSTNSANLELAPLTLTSQEGVPSQSSTGKNSLNSFPALKSCLSRKRHSRKHTKSVTWSSTITYCGDATMKLKSAAARPSSKLSDVTKRGYQTLANQPSLSPARTANTSAKVVSSSSKTQIASQSSAQSSSSQAPPVSASSRTSHLGYSARPSHPSSTAKANSSAKLLTGSPKPRTSSRSCIPPAVPDAPQIRTRPPPAPRPRRLSTPDLPEIEGTNFASMDAVFEAYAHFKTTERHSSQAKLDAKSEYLDSTCYPVDC
jgi:hypothetical protein